MRLFHGTNEQAARSAAGDGLLTRSALEIESNWDMPSREDLVYLTRGYAPYFAANASDAGSKWGLVEVEVDPGDLLPDEDFMEQATRGYDWTETIAANPPARGEFEVLLQMRGMVDRTRWFRERLSWFRHMAEASLEGLGNCAHEWDIDGADVVRVAVFDPKALGTLSMTAMDPTITIINWVICGEKYQALNRWMLGYDVTAEEVFATPAVHGMERSPVQMEALADLNEKMASHAGVEVIYER